MILSHCRNQDYLLRFKGAIYWKFV